MNAMHAKACFKMRNPSIQYYWKVMHDLVCVCENVRPDQCWET